MVVLELLIGCFFLTSVAFMECIIAYVEPILHSYDEAGKEDNDEN